MTPEVALYQRLAADAGVVALVADRIYIAGDIPQQAATFPLVTYQLISSTPLGITHDKRKDGRRPRVQLDIYSSAGPLELGQVESAIEDALHGAEWDTTDSDHAVAMQASGPRDLPPDDDADPAPGEKLHRRSVDYFVFYRKAA